MVLSQGFEIHTDGTLTVPDRASLKMSVPKDLLPVCPECGRPMSMNLRADDTFVQDSGWEEHARFYQEYLDSRRDSRVVFLELGVGYNTPGIIKYSFWDMTRKWENAAYACVNLGETYAPDEICDRSICIDGDISDILGKLTSAGKA